MTKKLALLCLCLLGFLTVNGCITSQPYYANFQYPWPNQVDSFLTIKSFLDFCKRVDIKDTVLVLVPDAYYSDKADLEDWEKMDQEWREKEYYSRIPLYLMKGGAHLSSAETLLVKQLTSDQDELHFPICIYVREGKPLGFSVGNAACTTAIRGI